MVRVGLATLTFERVAPCASPLDCLVVKTDLKAQNQQALKLRLTELITTTPLNCTGNFWSRPDRGWRPTQRDSRWEA